MTATTAAAPREGPRIPSGSPSDIAPRCVRLGPNRALETRRMGGSTSPAAVEQFRTGTPEQEAFGIKRVEEVVDSYYPGLLSTVKCCLAVFAAMSLGERTKPLCVIFETPSGYGKTAALQMTFPVAGLGLEQFVYRSDKFTPKAFVSHAANVRKEKLGKQDLLPRLENKVLVTKELAPIFRGRTEELTDNFSMLISVLDGKGFTSDSGMRGKRGYEKKILFNWVGATTPLPPATHRLMSQLGTRLLFNEVPAIELTETELLAYAKREDIGAAELICQQVVNEFLTKFLRDHPIGSLSAESISIPEERLTELVRWATFIAVGRAVIRYENESGWEPVAALQPEAPFKIINSLKELARAHALIHGREQVEAADLELISHVAISSIPAHVRPIVRELRISESVDTPRCAQLCRVSDTTARRYLKELSLLGIATLTLGEPKLNRPNSLNLADPFRWLRTLEHQVGGVG